MISKLSEKCKKCPHIDNCDIKRMEACAVMEVIKKVKIKPNIAVPLTAPIMAPILRDTSPQAQFREHVEKQISEQIYKDLRCAFMRGA